MTDLGYAFLTQDILKDTGYQHFVQLCETGNGTGSLPDDGEEEVEFDLDEEV